MQLTQFDVTWGSAPEVPAEPTTPLKKELKAIQDQGDKVKDCCKIGENLLRSRLTPSMIINTCQVCKRRHFYASVDPIKLGLTGGKVTCAVNGK